VRLKGHVDSLSPASGLEFALGILLALIVGIPPGLAAGWYCRFNYAVEPFLAALNATPQVAFLPLLSSPSTTRRWPDTRLTSSISIRVVRRFIQETPSIFTG